MNENWSFTALNTIIIIFLFKAVKLQFSFMMHHDAPVPIDWNNMKNKKNNTLFEISICVPWNQKVMLL